MNGRYYRVMIVDDQCTNREIIKNNNLWSPNSRFVVAGEAQDGSEALKLLDAEKFDVVITDILMPRINGIDLLRLIRANHPEVRVILVSGLKNFEYARQGMIYGASDYLIKPISEDHLQNALNRIELNFVGTEIELSREHFFEETIEGISNIIQSSAELSPEVIIKYINRIKSCQGAGDTDGRALLIRAVSMVLDRLVRPYFDMDMLRVAEAVVMRNWKDDGIINCGIRSLKSVESTSRELTLPQSKHDLVQKTVRLALGSVEMIKTVEGVAQALFVNRSYLSQVFRAQTGIALSEYLIRVKIYRSRILLMNPANSIAEIATRSGYRDEEYFSKIFKTYTGMLPRDYRKQISLANAGISK